MKQLRTIFKKVLPWLAAVAIFAWLFHLYPPQTILNSLKFMDIPRFCAVAVGYVLVMFVIDTFSISRVLALFGHREGVRELLPARGATYLLMIVNYAAGQAAFAFYQYRKHGIPISKMLGIFGIVVVVDLYLLVTIAFVATFFTTWPFTVAGMQIGDFVRIFAVAAWAGFAALVLVANRCANLSFVRRLRRVRLVDLIATTTLGRYLTVGLCRLPVHVFIMGGMYVAIRAFGLEIAFGKVLANIPIIFFIGSLPITPGGLGTGNAALVELFKPFVSSPAIAAGAVGAGELLFSFSLIWVFANYLMKAVIGVVCLKLVSRDLFRPTPGITEPMAEAEAVHTGGNL